LANFSRSCQGRHRLVTGYKLGVAGYELRVAG
jgi:hypothetical protein